MQGLPEPTLEAEDRDGETRPNTGEERKKEAVSKLVSIGNGNPDISISADDIVILFRLGAIRDDAAPRPLGVKLPSAQITILSSQGLLLKNCTTEWRKGVFLNPDLTLEQKDRERAAGEELKCKKQNGEVNSTIKNFQVVPFHRPLHGGHQNVNRDIARSPATHHEYIPDSVLTWDFHTCGNDTCEQEIFRYDYNKADYAKLCSILRNIDWSCVIELNNVDSACDYFYE